MMVSPPFTFPIDEGPGDTYINAPNPFPLPSAAIGGCTSCGLGAPRVVEPLLDLKLTTWDLGDEAASAAVGVAAGLLARKLLKLGWLGSIAAGAAAAFIIGPRVRIEKP
jgi:hypothetical protein